MSCEFERQAGLWKATDVIMLQDGPLMSLEQSIHTTCWLEYGSKPETKADLWQAQDVIATWRHGLLAEPADVPDADRLVQGG